MCDEENCSVPESVCPECLRRIPAFKVTDGDMVFLEKKCPEHDGKLEDGITEEQVTRRIIESLKRKKAEEAYEEWLGKIQSQYKIDLNKIEWQKIISSAG